MSGIVSISAADVMRLVSWRAAVDAIRSALALGLNPREQPARTIVTTTAGQLLLMPGEFDDMVGVKVLSVAPGNPAIGRERIQAVYTLMDAKTLTPVASIDGSALTTLRTPALSAVAVDILAVPDARRLVVFGTGPQAEAHVHAIRSVRDIRQIGLVGRNPGRAADLAARLSTTGVTVEVSDANAITQADVIATCTSARDPLFDGTRVPAHATVVAVGSHEPEARELDEQLFASASVVLVEDVDTALREAGDVIQAINRGAIARERLTEVRQLVMTPGIRSGASGPVVFKSVGQGWQDLVIARAAYQRWCAENTPETAEGKDV